MGENFTFIINLTYIKLSLSCIKINMMGNKYTCAINSTIFII